jgi:porphobilinogen deaminase
MPDGSHWIRDELDADATDPAAAGREIAQRLLAAGAAELLAASERASLR